MGLQVLGRVEAAWRCAWEGHLCLALGASRQGAACVLRLWDLAAWQPAPDLGNAGFTTKFHGSPLRVARSRARGGPLTAHRLRCGQQSVVHRLIVHPRH